MWPYALATASQAIRSPLAWALCAGAVCAMWFASVAAILAIDEVGLQAQPLLLGTAHLAAVLTTLWLVARGLEEDRQSGFAAAADATAPGPGGRLLGRWLGAASSGACVALLGGTVGSLLTVGDWPPVLLLLSTTIQCACLVGAWGVLLGTVWRGGVSALPVFLLWTLGHLPWGRDPFLSGPVGQALRALLPGPRGAGSVLEGLGYTAAAVAGLLLATLALCRPSES